jgi:membrane fusion protein (multidrug efflux system)
MKWFARGLISSGVLTVLLVGGCGKPDAAPAAPAAPPAQSVKVVAATTQPIARTLETTGEVVATNSVIVGATVEGLIVFCPWREGDAVAKAGEKLIEIDRASYREEANAAAAALAVAQAKLTDLQAGNRPEEIAQAQQTVKELEEGAAFAKTDLDRISKMVESGSLPGESLEKARVVYVSLATKLASSRQRLAMLQAGPTKTALAVQEALVKEAAARLELAKARLAECVIAAPFAGVVTKVQVRPGDLATAKAPLLEMADLSSLVVRFAVPEADAPALATGLRVAVSLDAYPGKTFPAKVIRLYPTLDRRMRTRTVEAMVVERVLLLPGMFARLKLELAAVADATVVPQEAVVVTPHGEQVAFVVIDGKARQRTITTGVEAGGKVQILTGVTGGEQVIVGGQAKLKDGSPVRLPAPAQGTGARAQGGGQ